MSVKLVMIVGGAITVAMYVFGLVYVLLQGNFIPNEPTVPMVIGGVVVMFATVLVFTLGFIKTGTQRS